MSNPFHEYCPKCDKFHPAGDCPKPSVPAPGSGSGSLGYLGNTLPGGIIGDPPDGEEVSAAENSLCLERLFKAIPADVLKKISLHDIHRIAKNYNSPPPQDVQSTVLSKAECIFQYCPHPELCGDECQCKQNIKAEETKTPPDQLCKWIPRDGGVPERLPCLANRRVLSGELTPCEICAPHLERVRRLLPIQNIVLSEPGSHKS